MEKTQFTIGKLLTNEVDRDAIHIAVMPVIAAETLETGQPVGLNNKGEACSYNERIGIVDPFFQRTDSDDDFERKWINAGEKFWLFLFPNSIETIRHEWIHPLLDRKLAIKNEHEIWLREFSDKWHFNFDKLISSALEQHTENWDRYATAYGKDLHSANELGEDHDLFWFHLSAWKGVKISAKQRETFTWSCSC